jgi:hypothetical protein
MLGDIVGAPQQVELTLYTDAYAVRGTITTRQRRISDILNHAEDGFLVLTETTLEEFGHRADRITSTYAQINLAAVLFAITELSVEPVPELRTPKVTEHALISIPPFKVSGRIHLLPGRDLREGLSELTGRFLPVTDATYWSDSAGEARKTATMVAVNHDRAQILIPYEG